MQQKRKAPRKLVCLETYWSDRHVQAFRERSVRPFFEGLATSKSVAVTDANACQEIAADLRKAALRGSRNGHADTRHSWVWRDHATQGHDHASPRPD